MRVADCKGGGEHLGKKGNVLLPLPHCVQVINIYNQSNTQRTFYHKFGARRRKYSFTTAGSIKFPLL